MNYNHLTALQMIVSVSFTEVLTTNSDDGESWKACSPALPLARAGGNCGPGAYGYGPGLGWGGTGYRGRGNVELNWPKLFQAFSVKLTLIFFMSAFIQSYHISTCKKYAY